MNVNFASEKTPTHTNSFNNFHHKTVIVSLTHNIPKTNISRPIYLPHRPKHTKWKKQLQQEQTPGFHSTGIFERSLKGGDEAKRHLW